MQRTPKELADDIQKNNPKLLENMNTNLIALIIKEAFSTIKNDIDTMDEGVIDIGRLGKFKIMKIDKEKEVLKRVIFKLKK